MRKMGIRAVVRRKFRVTTDSRHKYPVAPNLLERDFTTDLPDQVWVSDITYLWTRTGWLYLTAIIDLFSRMVVGWSLSSSLGHEMVLTALYRAIRQRRPPKGLIFHSDRGVQYACNGFTKVLKKHGIIQSMSRKGNCWDNAVAESFFSILKSELVYQTNFYNKQDALQKVFEYIEIYYNRQRKHSTIGYMNPSQYEDQFWKKCA